MRNVPVTFQKGSSVSLEKEVKCRGHIKVTI